jgi:hypothetical protein
MCRIGVIQFKEIFMGEEKIVLVKIIDGRGWYSDEKGNEYQVIQHPDYQEYWKLPYTNKVISKSNCVIVQPAPEPKMFVKITKVDSLVWYKNHMGQIFEVDLDFEGGDNIFTEKNFYHVVGTKQYIFRSDCVLVDAEEVKPKSAYLQPRAEHIKQRMSDITKAIQADLNNGTVSPNEWYSELQELSQQLKGLQ